jgi:hypothetical protein
MSIAAEATQKSNAMIASRNSRLKKDKNEKERKGFQNSGQSGNFIYTVCQH